MKQRETVEVPQVLIVIVHVVGSSLRHEISHPRAGYHRRPKGSAVLCGWMAGNGTHVHWTVRAKCLRSTEVLSQVKALSYTTMYF